AITDAVKLLLVAGGDHRRITVTKCDPQMLNDFLDHGGIGAGIVFLHVCKVVGHQISLPAPRIQFGEACGPPALQMLEDSPLQCKAWLEQSCESTRALTDRQKANRLLRPFIFSHRALYSACR